MAGRNDIEINLKTIAKTGDLANLLDYIHKLGKSLREVGTEDAKVLRNQLAAALKSIPKNATADKVKALVPDLSKINALGSLAGIDKKLTQFGTAQAKAVQQTVKEMRGAIEGGALSDETIEMLSASLQKFVEQANKLPPAGLKKLATDIQKTIANTQELQEVIAQANDIEFNVKTDGTGSLDELQHKIEVIANAKNLDDGIKELNAALLTLDSKESEAVAEQLERIKKLLEGELGQKQVKELRDEMRKLASVSSNLSSRELQRVGNSLNAVQAQGRALGEEMKKSGSKIADSFDPLEALKDTVGVSVSSVEQNIVGLAAKIGKMVSGTKAWSAVVSILPAKFKAVGAAMMALPIGWILALVGAIVKLVQSTAQYIREAGERIEDIKIGNLERSLESITSQLEVQKHIIDYIAEKEEARLKAIKEQRDATHGLTEAQAELNNEREKYGLLTEEQKETLSIRQDKEKADRDYRKAMADNQSDLQIAVNDLERGDKQSAERNAAKNDLRKLANMAGEEFRSLTKEAQSAYIQTLSSVGLHYDPEDFASRVEDVRKQARAKEQELIKEEDRWQNERIGKVSNIETLQKQPQVIKAKRDIELQKIEERQFALDREQKQRIHNREREDELYEYDTELKESDYRRDRKSPWQNDYQKLEEAKRWHARFLKEEQEALAARDRVLAGFRKSGRTEMLTEEQTALQEATSDLTRSRSSRYQEQTTIDQLEKALHDRRFDEAESQYSLKREDAEAVKARLDMYRSDGEKLKVERERYAKAVRDYEAANRKIQDDNNGTRTLSPEERKIAERERNNARSYLTESRSAIAQLEKALYDRRFDESEARHSIEKEDADWERNRIYSRANYAQKLAMDRRRYAAAQKEYAEADAAILADNAGTKTLSPEERKVIERRRTEARAYMTESREAISNAVYEGDTQRAGFYNSIMRHSNRLTAMGLGGDVANWDKQTANNTKTLVSQNRDLLQYFRSDRGANGGLAMRWGL